MGVVSSATPEATAAGVGILESDGNAVDAAVAVSFALGVTEPAMSGLGGQTQMLIFSPGFGPVVINGSSFSPRATPPSALKQDLLGHRATTVPTTVKVLDHAWRRFGSGNLRWAELLEPAIRYAQEGFRIGPFRHRVLVRHHRDLDNGGSTRELFLNPDGSSPGEGEIWRQPLLAETLRRIAAGGAEAFYRGDLAREIVRDMETHGGWIRSEDLAELADPVELAPLRARYRDDDVWSLPPPGGGSVVLRILNLLEQCPPQQLRPGRPDRTVTLARILHLGHIERFRNHMADLRDYDLETGNVSGETTHFSLVDRRGMAVSVSASLNTYYGAKAAHGSLGFLYNDYMNEFELGQPGHPFAIRPSAMPYSSMSPTILTRDGAARLALGSPGSERIASAVSQVIQLWVDEGLSLQEAVDLPRIHAGVSRELFVEMTEDDGSAIDALLEDGFELETPAADVARGRRNAFFGGVHAVGFENGAWVGAADPRRDGAVGLARGPNR